MNNGSEFDSQLRTMGWWGYMVEKWKPHILIPRRVVFVIDKSGSMSGTKWIKTKAATIVALKQLRVNYDRGGIIFFDDYVERALPNLIPATVRL